MLVYQSDSQVTSAFKDKPTLLYDNCSTQIYLKVTSIETAERLSKSLGDFTQEVESDGDSWGTNWGRVRRRTSGDNSMPLNVE